MKDSNLGVSINVCVALNEASRQTAAGVVV